MKRKILCALLSVIFCVMGIVRLDVVASTDVQSEDIEMSELFTEDALIGYAEKQTWGIYLASGNSVINKISSSKVGAGVDAFSTKNSRSFSTCFASFNITGTIFSFTTQ